MVLEIHPSGATKGTAIADLLRGPPFRGRRPIYIGDDRPDEAAFDAVNRAEGVSVIVGPGDGSLARYRLADVPAVIAWLEAFAYADGADDDDLDSGPHRGHLS
jgi:trehalose 6-phosphate phosphatase